MGERWWPVLISSLVSCTDGSPEQLSLGHSKGMRLNWTGPAEAKHCMVEARRATPSLGDGEGDRNQAGSGGWIKSPTLNPSISRNPPPPTLPAYASIAYQPMP